MKTKSTYSKAVLGDSSNSHDFSRYWPIAVNGVRDGDGRDGDDLDADEPEADDDDGRPWPFFLQANAERLCTCYDQPSFLQSATVLMRVFSQLTQQ